MKSTNVSFEVFTFNSHQILVNTYVPIETHTHIHTFKKHIESSKFIQTHDSKVSAFRICAQIPQCLRPPTVVFFTKKKNTAL